MLNLTKLTLAIVVKRIQKENKLSTTFNPEEFSVIDRRGSEAVLQSKDSNRIIQRNVSHLKKLFILNGPNSPIEQTLRPDNSLHTNSNIKENSCTKTPAAMETNERPRRAPKLPGHLKEFEVNKVQ